MVVSPQLADFRSSSCYSEEKPEGRQYKSDIVNAALAGYLRGRIELHFLPPYSPDHNRIERVWQDLHANVTRNHTCPTMVALMRAVRYYLRKRNRKLLGAKNSNRQKKATA
jgi:transposase